MTLSTGDPVLDEALGGGIPTGETTLVTGGPGAGKSTLAFQFLQEGLDRGEECLYVATEQSIRSLRRAFADFSFDVDHERLRLTSVNATPGYTLDSDEETLTLTTVENGDTRDESVPAPFRTRFIRDYLKNFAPCDRVVLDSVSGLRPMADDPFVFRRSVLDLLQYFGDEVDATSLVVSERPDCTDEPVTHDPFQFSADAVVSLSQESIGGELHRFLRIRKRRGVDHDRRKLAYSIEDSGLDVHSRAAPSHPVTKTMGTLPTGIDGLDDLLGGGLVRGAANAIEHDGDAHVAPIVAGVCESVLERDEALLFVPGAAFEWSRLEGYVGRDPEALLESGRLYVVDAFGTVGEDRPNVSRLGGNRSLADLLESIDRRRDRPLCSIVDVGALEHRLQTSELRSIRSDVRSTVAGDEDTTVYVSNADAVDSRLQSWTVGAARLVCRTWLRESGLQAITLRTAPRGLVGGTRLVEHVEEPPYVRVRA